MNEEISKKRISGWTCVDWKDIPPYFFGNCSCDSWWSRSVKNFEIFYLHEKTAPIQQQVPPTRCLLYSYWSALYFVSCRDVTLMREHDHLRNHSLNCSLNHALFNKLFKQCLAILSRFLMFSKQAGFEWCNLIILVN